MASTRRRDRSTASSTAISSRRFMLPYGGSASLVADRTPAGQKNRGEPGRGGTIAIAGFTKSPSAAGLLGEDGMLMMPAPSLMRISDPVTTRTGTKAGGGIWNHAARFLASHARPGREGPEQGSSRGKRG